MSMWEKLKEVALIGTDRKVLDLKLLPDSIGEELSKQENLSEDERFLQACAYGSYYLQAGNTPQQVSGEIDLPIIEESHQVAEEEALQFFKQIDEADHLVRDYLFRAWMELLISKNWIVSADMILPTVALASAGSKQVKEQASKIIGDKGRWILSFKDDFNFTISESIDTWEEGTTDQRKKYLEELISSKPAAALEAIQSTWDGESIAFKKAILLLVSAGYQEVFTPFLEDLYNNEFAWRSKEKKTEKECRQILAGLLLRAGNGALYESTVLKLQTYFESKKRSGMLSFMAGNRQVFSLPDQADDFWNEEFMLQSYGLDNKYDIAIFENDPLYWLSFFIEHVGAQWWSGQFDKGTEEFVNYFLGESSFQTKIGGKPLHIFESSLVDNAIHFRDEEVAIRLVKDANRERASQLVGLMSVDQYETYLTRRNLLLDYQMLDNSPDKQWSNDFSKSIIQEAFDQIKQGHYYAIQNLPKVLAGHMDLQSEVVLDKYHTKARELSYFNSWEKYFYNPLKAIFSIKKLTDSYH